MEITFAPPKMEIFDKRVEQEQTLEKTLKNKLHEMSNIILNHQNKIKNIKSIKYVLDTNSDIINTIPDFITARDLYINKIKTLNDFYEGTKLNFLKIILQVGEALKEYGVMTDNSEIIEQGKIKKEQLIKKPDKDIVKHGLTIFGLIKPYFQSLCQIGNLNSLVSRINELPEFPHDIAPLKEVNSIDIYNSLYNDIKVFLCKTIDVLTNEIKEKYPHFYIEYKTVRIASNIETSQNYSPAPVWVI